MFKRFRIRTMAMAGVLAAAAFAAGFGAVSLTPATLAAGPSAPATDSPTTAHPVDHWPAWIQGRPLSLHAGGALGYYFWHDETGLHLWTTTPSNRDHVFTAVLTTRGTFRDVSGQQLEPGDHYKVLDHGHRLVMQVHTYSGIDGVNFRIDGGDGVTLRLYYDGHLIDPSNIFAGRFSVHPRANPFTVER